MCLKYLRATVTFVAQLVKNLPAMRETWVWSVGWEDPQEKRKAKPTPVFWPREFHELTKSWTQLSDFHFSHLKDSKSSIPQITYNKQTPFQCPLPGALPYTPTPSPRHTHTHTHTHTQHSNSTTLQVVFLQSSHHWQNYCGLPLCVRLNNSPNIKVRIPRTCKYIICKRDSRDVS